MTDKELRELAEMATPGPWTFETGPQANTIRAAALDAEATPGMVRAVAIAGIDAAYIAAASPTTVIALLDRLEAAEKALGRLVAMEDEWKTHPSPEVMDRYDRTFDEARSLLGKAEQE